MANYCTTTFYFYGEADELANFYGDIVNCVLNAPKKKPGVFSPWLGDFLIDAGLEPNKYESAGELAEYKYDYDNKRVVINTYTKWFPCAEMWQAILTKRKYNSIKFAYESIDESVEWIEIYNPHNFDIDFDEFYVNISYQGNELEDWFKCEEDALDKINEVFNSSLTSMSDICFYINDDEDEWCIITQAEHTSIIGK